MAISRDTILKLAANCIDDATLKSEVDDLRDELRVLVEAVKSHLFYNDGRHKFTELRNALKPFLEG